MPDDSLNVVSKLREDGELRLVCDTNVYLNAREAIGVLDDGRLRETSEGASTSPDVAVLRAPSMAGVPVRFIVALAVRNELFYLIREGYSERPTGLKDARLTAAALKDLMDLHPPGSLSIGGPTLEAQLPDPPLSAAETNDRHIWFEADRSSAILITSDEPLLEAVRQQAGRQWAAARPHELISIGQQLLNASQTED